jgi:GGDEF domain-containing protein
VSKILLKNPIESRNNSTSQIRGSIRTNIGNDDFNKRTSVKNPFLAKEFQHQPRDRSSRPGSVDMNASYQLWDESNNPSGQRRTFDPKSNPHTGRSHMSECSGIKNLNKEKKSYSITNILGDLCGLTKFMGGSPENEDFSNQKKELQDSRLPDDSYGNFISLPSPHKPSILGQSGHHPQPHFGHQSSTYPLPNKTPRSPTPLQNSSLNSTLLQHKTGAPHNVYDDNYSRDLNTSQSNVTYTQLVNSNIQEHQKNIEFYEKQNIAMFYKIKNLKNINKNLNLHNEANKYLSSYIKSLRKKQKSLVEDCQAKDSEINNHEFGVVGLREDNERNKEILERLKIKQNKFFEGKGVMQGLEKSIGECREVFKEHERKRHMILGELVQNFEKDKRKFCEEALMKIAYELSWKMENHEVQEMKNRIKILKDKVESKRARGGG